MDSSDHRIIGRQLDLFSIDEDIGVGLVLWHPKGAIVRRIIRNFWEDEHLKNGYQLVSTPHIARGELWEISGHMEYYSENMYIFEKAGEQYVVKPMNCPFHIGLYKSRPRSYRELPLRYAEWGTVYRYERSGTLHGLMRVRGFTQDDAHIFCAPEQLDEEIMRALELAERVLGRLGFSEYSVELSLRDPENPEDYMGSEDEWSWAQSSLIRALEKRGVQYAEMLGEAAFYGPKIDVKIVDVSGREWQCSTIQLDYNLPKRFDLAYMGDDGGDHVPLMIHRVLLGAVERFFGILVEHHRGNLPTWLAPIQVRAISISDEQRRYSRDVARRLRAEGVRGESDDRDSTLAYKIRAAETEKIPYMAVCGGREEESNTLSVRRHGGERLGALTVEELIKMVQDENRPEESRETNHRT
jgi:threonyl-tRNA synthetase